MPLYERLITLGIIGRNDQNKPAYSVDIKPGIKPASDDDPRTDEPGHSETETDEDDKAVRAAFKRSQKKKPLLVIDSDDSDSEYYASSESDLRTDIHSFDDFDDNSDEDMSETQMRNEQAVRHVIGNSKDTMALLGTAEALRRQSQGCETTTATTTANPSLAICAMDKNSPQKQETMAHAGQMPAATLPAQFIPLKYPTGDVDASDGFEVCGFKGGKRVYRLESPHITRLRSMVVKTGVGYCYLDITSMLPPTVVEVPAEPAPADPDEKSLRALPAPPTPPTTPPGSPWPVTQIVDSVAALAVSASPSSPPSPQHRPHLHVNGCFAIRPSTLGGLGAFALRELYRGEHILVEEPLFRTTLFHMPHELDKLAPEKRAQFYALTGHHPDPNASTAEKIWTANTFEAGSMEAVFSLASRFNHACTPRNNIGYHFDRRKNVLIMTAIKKIPAGTELLITYGKSPSELFLRFGFRCVCGACTGFTEDMSREQQLKNWSG